MGDTRKFIAQLWKNQATPSQKKLAIRNTTMALLMLDMGLRASEVLRLTVYELCFQGKPVDTLHVPRGYGQRSYERDVPLTDQVRSFVGLMSRYWWTPDGGKAGGNFAFYNRSSVRPISQRQFQRIVKQAGLEALGYPVRPHDLRRV